MGIMRKIRKVAPKLASRPTRSQRKKGALASKVEAAAQAAAAGKRLNRSQREAYSAAGKRLNRSQREAYSAAGKRLNRSQRKAYGAAMLKSVPQGLAATLRRTSTAGTRSRPSWLKATPQGLYSRKRSR